MHSSYFNPIDVVAPLCLLAMVIVPWYLSCSLMCMIGHVFYEAGSPVSFPNLHLVRLIRNSF